MATTTNTHPTARETANRANAQHSTGPRTEEGKTRSAANALKHGFRSSSVLLPGDDPAEFEALHAEIAEHFPGTDLTETRAVHEMTNAEWRLRRVREYISITLEKAIATLQAENPSLPALELQALAFTTARADLAPLLKYEQKFERQYDRAYRTWTQYQEVKRLDDFARTEEIVERYQEEQKQAEKENGTNEPNPQATTPRNAPCPCGSGIKYKRCCGQNAPPVHHPAGQKATQAAAGARV